MEDGFARLRLRCFVQWPRVHILLDILPEWGARAFSLWLWNREKPTDPEGYWTCDPDFRAPGSNRWADSAPPASPLLSHQGPALHFLNLVRLLPNTPSSLLEIKKRRCRLEQSEKKINHDLNSCLWTHSLARWTPLASSLPPPFCDLVQAVALCVCVKIPLNAFPWGQSMRLSLKCSANGDVREGMKNPTFQVSLKLGARRKRKKKSCPFPFFSPRTSNANAKCVVLGPE